MNKPYGRTNIQENEDGRLMLGGGCKTCPVIACATMTYRGSACASQRASYGLGDPITNEDYVLSLRGEELALFLNKVVVNCFHCPMKAAKPCDTEGIIDWLKAPYKEKEE